MTILHFGKLKKPACISNPCDQMDVYEKLIAGIQNAQAGHATDAMAFINDLEKKLNEQDKQGKQDKHKRRHIS